MSEILTIIAKCIRKGSSTLLKTERGHSSFSFHHKFCFLLVLFRKKKIIGFVLVHNQRGIQSARSTVTANHNN